MIKSVIKKTLNFAGFIMLTTIINFKELTLQGFSIKRCAYRILSYNR